MGGWKEWVQARNLNEILEAQVPHNVTYWIRHNTTCANGFKCCHNKADGYNAVPMDYVRQGVQHYGHGYCYDCYIDLGLGSGAKIPGPN